MAVVKHKNLEKLLDEVSKFSETEVLEIKSDTDIEFLSNKKFHELLKNRQVLVELSNLEVSNSINIDEWYQKHQQSFENHSISILWLFKTCSCFMFSNEQSQLNLIKSSDSIKKKELKTYLWNSIKSDNFLFIRFLLANFYDQLKVYYEQTGEEAKEHFYTNETTGSILQTAAEESKDVRTLAALLQIEYPLKGKEIVLLDDKRIKLIEYTSSSFRNSALYICAKKGKRDMVELLIRCQADISRKEVSYEGGKVSKRSPLKVACKKGQFDIAFLLLQFDSDPASVEYLTELDLGKTPDDSEDLKKMKKLLRERNKFHSYIREAKIDKVKEYLENTKLKSKYFFNQEGKSARLALIESLIDAKNQVESAEERKSRYDIYQILLENNLFFKDEKEENESVEKLSKIEKIKLRDHLLSKTLLDPNKTTEYLTTISRSIGKEKVDFKNLYVRLNEIKEIQPILRVIQFGQFSCSNFIQILFDSNQDSISDLFPGEQRSSKGICQFKKGIIHIGAKCESESHLLGTLAHELTHLAIQIVYQNGCFPYKKEDDSKKQEFKEIIHEYKSCQHLDEIIMRCFECYDEKLWPSELIVRVNHVLAHYGNEIGEKKLKEQVPKLVKYFRKTVLSDCERFIENGMLNGEFNEIETLNLFSEIIHHVDYLNIEFAHFTSQYTSTLRDKQKKIVFIQTENTFLSTIKLYQFLKSDEIDIWKKSLCLKFNENSRKREMKALGFNAWKHVIIQVSSSNCHRCQDLLSDDEFLQKVDKDKKIIFICQEDHLKQLLSQFSDESLANKIIDDEIKWKDFKIESKIKLLGKYVKFQGITILLRDLLGINENTDLNNLQPDILKIFESIDCKTFEKLFRNNGKQHEDTVEIGKITQSSYNDISSYYIERKLHLFNKIDKSISNVNDDFEDKQISNVNDDFEDKLVISDDRMIPNQAMETFLKNIPMGNSFIKNDRFHFVKNESEFKKICDENKKHNIHWIKADSGNLLFIKTHGKMSSIRKYLKSDKEPEILDESSVFNLNNNKIIIISAEPGMGKSSLLNTLYKRCIKTYQNVLVVQIVLRDHVEVYQNLAKSQNLLEDFINLILKLENQFEKSLFEYLSKTEKLILMFDGFDEVSHYKYELLQLFDSLLESLNVKNIVITTRNHLKDELEEKFGVLSFSISPLGVDDDCQYYLNKYWLQSIKVDEKSIEKIQRYSKNLVNKLKGSILNKFKNFIEIPLQLKMIADIYKNDLIEQLENKAKISSLEISNLTDLYEKFIDSKFIIKYNEKNNINIERDKFIYNDTKDKILRYHIHFSKIYIINNNNEDPKEQVLEENMMAEALGYGIIVNFKDSMPIFIHQSYAEYFVASFVFNSIKKKEIPDILEDILFIDKYFLVRKFLDGFFERIKQLETRDIIFEKLKIKNKHILHVAASENMKHRVGADLNSTNYFWIFF